MKKYIVGIQLEDKIEMYRGKCLISDAVDLDEAKNMQKKNKKLKIYCLVEVKK